MRILGPIILFALFAATFAAFPQISPSFSFEASLELSTITSNPRFNVANDVNRLLQYVNSTNGDGTETFIVSSEFDSATYTNEDGQCTSSAFDTLAYFPLTLDVWSRFELGKEDPSGTYTIEKFSSYAYSSEELVIVNDLPVSYSRIISSSTFVLYTTITITKFNNVVPLSSSFNLPADCAQFTCIACQNPSYTTNYNPTETPTETPTQPSENLLQLPSSFSFKGTAIQTSTYGGTQTFTRYDVAVDSTRMLVINDKEFSNGEFRFVLESEDDNVTFTNLNGVCETAPFRVDSYNSFSSPTHIWDVFNTATEEPEGTFTVESNGITHEIVLEGGLPVSFAFIVEVGYVSYALRISITEFINSPPPLSEFSLPEVCSNYTCDACYNSAAAGAASTLMLIFFAMIMLFFTAK